jgi:Fic family protein
LSRARTHNDLKQWLIFFLTGVVQTAQSSIDTFKKIIELKKNIETKKIITLGKKAKKAQLFLNYLFTQPLVESSEVAEVLKINVSTANRLIDDMIRLSVLVETTGFKRNRTFVFREYIDMFEN